MKKLFIIFLLTMLAVAAFSQSKTRSITVVPASQWRSAGASTPRQYTVTQVSPRTAVVRKQVNWRDTRASYKRIERKTKTKTK